MLEVLFELLVVTGGDKSQLLCPAWLVCKSASSPARLILLISTCPKNKGNNFTSSSICLKASIWDWLAQDALLRVTCSALTPIEGKILRLTGPAILRSLPVASLTAELSNWVNCVGLIDDAAYQTPRAPRAKIVAKVIRMILKVLFITDSFYIELIGIVSPIFISRASPI